MRRCWLLPVIALAGCGEPDRETFVREANAACRERAAGQDALAGLPASELVPAATRLYEQELERLRALEPPDADRARHAEWVRASADVLSAYRRLEDDASNQAARDRVTEQYEYAAALAGRLGLADCDS